MNIQKTESVVPMPAWLFDQCIAVAAELERMHGAEFAAAFLKDIGATQNSRSNTPPVQETHQHRSSHT
jgi:hypothetical protein